MSGTVSVQSDAEEDLMSRAQQMLQTHPRGIQIDTGVLAACIQACYECAQCCTSCADACLGEDHVADLARCVRINMDCADACVATGGMLSRQTMPNWTLLRAQVESCMLTCQICSDECEHHAGRMAHCRVCAECCRACDDACNRLLSEIGSMASV
jgi:hypothetical protein